MVLECRALPWAPYRATLVLHRRRSPPCVVLLNTNTRAHGCAPGTGGSHEKTGARGNRPVVHAEAVEAIAWCGLEPVFADLDAATWHLDAEQLEQEISNRGERVACVLACSTFGAAPPIAVRQRWEAACAAGDIPLLVDSASGFGSLDEAGRRLGRQGDAEVFSFHATKPFAMSEGGLVVTENVDLADEMRLLINFGLDERRARFGDTG